MAFVIKCTIKVPIATKLQVKVNESVAAAGLRYGGLLMHYSVLTTHTIAFFTARRVSVWLEWRHSMSE